MHWLILSIAVYIAAVVETSLGAVLAVGGTRPDLLALVLTTWLLYSPDRRFVAVPFAIGLIADLTAAPPPGVGLTSFLVMSWLLAHLAARYSYSNTAWNVLITAIAVSGATFLTACWHQALGYLDLPWSSFPLRSISVGAYTAACAIPVMMVMGWLTEPTALRRA